MDGFRSKVWLEEHHQNEVIENEEFALLDDTDSMAETEYSVYESDTEQSGIDEEAVPLKSQDKYQKLDFYLGRDRVTKWYLHPPVRTIKMKKTVLTPIASVHKFAKDAYTPLGCWKMFFSDSIIEEIVRYTNIYLAKIRENYSRQSDCHDTNLDELTAFFGLLYLIGIEKSNHLTIKDLWDPSESAAEYCRAVMSIKRFSLLLSGIRFDDINTRSDRQQFDNLAPIRKIFEDFNEKCKLNYSPGKFVTLDVMLEPFRGHCKFRQYMQHKPGNYGIKIWSLIDAQVYYTINMEIYTGKQPDGPCCLPNDISNVVKRIASPILKTGRNLTLSESFTSIPFAEELLNKYQTTIVGTLHKCHKEVPTTFLEIKSRPLHNNLFGFRENMTLVSYIPKKGKTVVILSTMNEDNKNHGTSGARKRPDLLTLYNSTKRAVEAVDEEKTLYSVARTTSRWPMVIFYTLLNIAGINAQVIHEANTNEIMTRRVFLKDLSVALVKPQLLTRSAIKTLPMSLRQTIARIANISPPEQQNVVCNSGTKRGTSFCALCPRKKNRKTQKTCVTCAIAI